MTRGRDLARAHRRRKTRRYRSLLLTWAGQRLRAPAGGDVEPPPPVAPGQVSVTRAGHATLLIRYPGLTVITDPLLTSRCRGVTRVEPLGVDQDQLDAVDLILISGAEPDHLHRPSLERLPRTATCVVPASAAGALAGLGFDRVVELGRGAGFNLRGVEVLATAARADRPASSYLLFGAGPSVFYAGIGGYSDGFADVGARHRPDVALLPIGGYVPLSFRRRHLSPLDAVTAFEDLGARVLIPHRYGAFCFSYERLGEPERWLEDLIEERSLERYVVCLRSGESRVLVPPRGRAGTEMGEPRRPIGVAEPGEDEAEDIDLDGGDGDEGAEPEPRASVRL